VSGTCSFPMLSYPSWKGSGDSNEEPAKTLRLNPRCSAIKPAIASRSDAFRSSLQLAAVGWLLPPVSIPRDATHCSHQRVSCFTRSLPGPEICSPRQPADDHDLHKPIRRGVVRKDPSAELLKRSHAHIKGGCLPRSLPLSSQLLLKP